MGLMDRLRGRTREDRTTSTPVTAPPAPPPPPSPRPMGRIAAVRISAQPAAASTARQRSASAVDIDDESNPRWYAAPDGNNQRFIGADGRPTVHLIRYDGLLRFCEDSTGLLVGPTDRRLLPAGLLVSNLRGGRYNEADCRAGDFSPGATVRLVPEPDNPHDDQAVAVFDRTGRYRAGYVNKMKARAYLKRLAAGEELVAISLRGSRPGGDAGVVSILVAAPAVLAHVRAARPPGSPPPVYSR